MYRLPSCAECVPLTWLAPGLDQSPSSLLPAWYQFWSFRAAPPSQFRRGRRTDLSPRGRVPSFPEVPGRALTPDSSKWLHIHAALQSSMPARPFLYTSPGDPHGRVPSFPEVPGRAFTPDSSKRLHIHAALSSSMPAWPFLYTPPGDPHAPL